MLIGLQVFPQLLKTGASSNPGNIQSGYFLVEMFKYQVQTGSLQEEQHDHRRHFFILCSLQTQIQELVCNHRASPALPRTDLYQEI